MKILGIESSCDETGIAIVENSDNRVFIVAEALNSQTEVHEEYGGVVPEMAARKHITAITPLLKKVFHDSKLEIKDIDAIAVTAGPGLVSSLLVGIDTAKSLSFVWHKPLIPINHIAGHIAAAWIAENKADKLPKFPCLALVVSGGHTELVLIKNHGQFKYLGGTRDDAAGEAFDKVGKLLGLPYPGGPAIAKLAKTGNDRAFDLPIPMLKYKNLDFSFSGLKTAMLYIVKRRTQKLTVKEKRDLAASFERVVVDVLVQKTLQALEQVKCKSVVLVGGVAANNRLRQQLASSISLHNLPLFVPAKKLCTDNAAMIAAAGSFMFNKHLLSTWQDTKVRANWELYEPII
ncbi:MAG: tRNA (adenosine(37)-N6)-threonylcarbamoyltransferase complex transferase subunit TsaD [bacterium]